MISITFHEWPEAQDQARAVRFAVFVLEQRIPESEEWDDMDAISLHGLARFGGQVVGTVRLLPDGKIGRMAVMCEHRRRGVGKALLGAAVKLAASRGHLRVSLSAQSHLVDWYQSQGFMAEGPAHEEVGIPHQWMTMDLNQHQVNFR